MLQVATPTFSPSAPQTFSGSVDVTISCVTPGAIIYYTLDGSTPTPFSSVFTSPIHLTATTTLNAYAVANSFTDSVVVTGIYTAASNDPTLGFDLWGFQTFGPTGGITILTFSEPTSLGGFDIESDPELLELHFPNLASIDPTNTQSGFLTVTNNIHLTVLDMPVFLPNPGSVYNLSANALNATSVNNFLHRCVLNASFTAGTVNLSGGTNAAPTGQGITDKATLSGRGVTIATN